MVKADGLTVQLLAVMGLFHTKLISTRTREGRGATKV